MTRSYRAPAIARAVAILDVLARSQGTVALSDIARAVECGKSSVLGILHSLVEVGWVEKDPADGRYRMGKGLLSLAQKAFGRWDLTAVARPSLERLARRLGESAFLGVRRGDRVVVEDCVEGGNEMCVAARPGVTMPLLAGATGKVFLAAMDMEEVQALLDGMVLRRFTDRTITERDNFLTAVERARNLGYSTDDEEYLRGVRAVVAPIRCRGETLAALWVAGFSATLSDQRFAVAVEQVVQEAEACSRLLELRAEGPDAG